MSGTCSSWRSVSQSGSGRALVVNDDFLFLDSLREVVVAAGFEVHCAAGPPEAMRLLERYRYDAVITAMGFAKAGADAGLSVVERARSRNPVSRVAVLVPTAADVCARLPEQASPDLWCVTPDDPAVLRDQVDMLLGRMRGAAKTGVASC